jgi:hypothetical protein
MPRSTRFTLLSCALLLMSGAACTDATSPTHALSRAIGPQALVLPGTVIPIPDVDSLYRVVNNPAYAGAILQLAPRTYVLEAARPNGGRLELQSGMSLQGSVGNAAAVTLDATALNTGTTGAVRLGRGTQSLRWLAVRNSTTGASGIATDLVAGPAQLTLSHLIVSGNRRGIDIRNTGAAAAGRVLLVTVEHSLIEANTLNAGQGIRILNSDGATGATILATFNSNIMRQNRLGTFIGNLNTTGSVVSLSSTSDRFESNATGLGIVGGAGLSGISNANTVSVGMTFPAFIANTSPLLSPGFPYNAGLSVEGGSAAGTGSTSSNTAAVSLIVPTFSGQASPIKDILAWGARSTTGSPAGQFNTASVAVVGATPTKSAIASEPAEPVPTNIVSVIP